MSEEKKNYQVNNENEIVDLDVMMNEPVPFAKFNGKVYSIKALTIEESRKYGKSMLLGPPVYTVVDDKARKAFIECFDTHVFDEDGNPVKFEDIEKKWPDKAIELFTKAILRISG